MNLEKKMLIVGQDSQFRYFLTQNSFDGQKSGLETSFESANCMKQEENAKVLRQRQKTARNEINAVKIPSIDGLITTGRCTRL